LFLKNRAGDLTHLLSKPPQYLSDIEGLGYYF